MQFAFQKYMLSCKVCFEFDRVSYLLASFTSNILYQFRFAFKFISVFPVLIYVRALLICTFISLILFKRVQQMVDNKSFIFDSVECGVSSVCKLLYNIYGTAIYQYTIAYTYK